MGHTISRRRAPKARTKAHLLTILLISSSAHILAACPPEPIFLPLDNCTINLPGQPTIHSWGAPLSVSSSEDSSTSLQYLCGVPSTVTNTTFYTTSLLCSDTNIRAQNITYAQCLSRRGGVLAVDASGQPTALQTTSTAGLNDSDPGWPTIMQPDAPFPAAVLAALHLGGAHSTMMTAGLIESGNNHTTTHLSLGDRSTLLSSLVSARLIAARSFGFDAGSRSYSLPRPGGLVLGGFDSAARSGPASARFAMADYRGAHQLNGRRTCPLQVTVASMSLRPGGAPSDGSADYNLGIEPAHPQQACLEMYDNLPRLPGGVIAKIQDGFAAFTGSAAKPIRYSATGAGYGDDPLARQLGDIYVPEPGLIYPRDNQTASFNGSLVVVLAEANFTVEIPLEELAGPLRGIARDGTRVANGNFTELAVYQDPAPEDAAVLGKVFLGRAYLYVDYDGGEFTLTQSAGSGSSGRTILVATGDDGSCAGGGGGTGWSRVTIALVVVVAVLGVVLLGFLACWWARKGRSDRLIVWPWWRRRRVQEEETGAVANGGKREDYPEVAHVVPGGAPMPVSERNGAPPADITPVPSEAAVLPRGATQQRSLSEDTGDSRFRGRIGSVEVQGTSPLDPPFTPDGHQPELEARERILAADSPRTRELVDMPPGPSSSNAQGHPIERLRTGSASTAEGDPLHVRRTNRSLSGGGWAG